MTPTWPLHYTMTTKLVSNGATIWPLRAIAILNIGKTWLESGSKMVASLSHTSMANAIPPTFSLRKCVTAQTSVASGTPSCQGLPTSSVEYSILSTLCQPLLPTMLLNTPVMSHPRALAYYLTSSFPNLRFARQFLNHAWHNLASISSRVLQIIFCCRLLWAILWGVLLYDTPTGYCLTKFSKLK